MTSPDTSRRLDTPSEPTPFADFVFFATIVTFTILGVLAFVSLV